MITGDLIDANHTDAGIVLCFAQESVRIAPTYYVAGNITYHPHFWGYQHFNMGYLETRI